MSDNELNIPFKLGDLVRLKSGGPVMTVGNGWGDGEIECVWFDGLQYNEKRLDYSMVVAVGNEARIQELKKDLLNQQEKLDHPIAAKNYINWVEELCQLLP